MGSAFAFAVLTLASAGYTQAQGPERLATAAFAVPRDPSGQKAAAAIGAILGERVAQHPKLRLIEPGRALSGDPRTREEETLLRARTALADGRRAYDALALDDAIARLGQSVSLYQQTGPLLGDLTELQTALAYLGAALTLRGSSDEGVSTFLELLTIDPGYAPDGFPPTVTRIFDRAVERLGALAKGSVEIYSTPPYSAVFVDGRFRGVTPLTLADLHAGTHYIRLEQNGYVTHGAPLEVAPNQRITSQTRLTGIKSGAELRDLLSRSSREVLQEGMGQHARSLARLLVADALILISVSQSGKDASITGAAFDASGAIRLATERTVIDAEGPNFFRDSSALIDKLLASAAGTAAPSFAPGQDPGSASGFGLSAGAGVNQGGGGSPPSGGYGGYGSPTQVQVNRGEDGSPPAGQVIGWMMVGIGTVGLGTGVVFAILTKQTHDDYLATPQSSPDLASIRDDGKTRALIADVAMIGGAALIAGGVVTLLLTSKSSDAPEELLGFVPLDGGGLVFVGGTL